MATQYTDEFRREAVRLAITSGLARPKVASDLGVGLSTLRPKNGLKTQMFRLSSREPDNKVTFMQ